MNNIVIVTLELLAMSIGCIIGYLACVKIGNIQLDKKDEQLKQVLKLLDKSTTNNQQLINQNLHLLKFTIQEFDENEDDDDDEGGEEVKEFNLRNN